MSDETKSQTYFWAYDIFGYFFPGVIALGGLTVSNSIVYNYFESITSLKDLMAGSIIVICSYIAGHIIAAISSYVLEKIALRNILGYPTKNLFNSPSNKPCWCKEILFPGYFKPYSQEFQKRVDDNFQSKFSFIPSDHHDRFWMIWEYVSLNHQIAYKRATHHLDLYGFARNTSMSFILLAFSPIYPGWNTDIHTFSWVILSAIFAWFLFLNYTKSIRRLDDEIYRAFASLS